MTTSFRTIAGTLLLAGMLGLTACNPAGNGEAANTAPATAPVTAQPETGSGAAAESKGAGTSAAPDTAVIEPPATASSEAAGGGGEAADQAADYSKQLKELLELAKQGRVPGVEYAAHSGMIDEVEAAWGEPDTKESAGKGMYAVYSDKHTVFGFNKGSKIFDVRSSASNLQTLTLRQIEEVLGKPDNTAVNGSDKIYIYQAGEQYELKFIIPESTGRVDHISVFSAQDSINNMAG
jgi:hypothetical protein